MKYYARVPSAAVFPMFDGNLYANVNFAMRSLPDGRVTFIETALDEYRMLQVSFVKHGEAYAYLGKIGAAIACPTNLPFGVSCFDDADEVPS